MWNTNHSAPKALVESLNNQVAQLMEDNRHLREQNALLLEMVKKQMG